MDFQHFYYSSDFPLNSCEPRFGISGTLGLIIMSLRILANNVGGAKPRTSEPLSVVVFVEIGLIVLKNIFFDVCSCLLLCFYVFCILNLI